ncbi:MAG: diguanylate cyclase (GGDEF)-like protein [Paraglaciecola sp.]|jgi:diguanylate cyclase (GGDEF)-like protein
MNLKKSIGNYLKTGTSKADDSETNQQIFVANLFGFVGYLITFLMAISAFLRSDYLLAMVLIVTSILFFSSHLILRFKPFKNSYKFSANFVTISLMILMVFLVYAGGISNTGPLWIYIVPPVALYFGGMRKGLRNLGLFSVVIGGLMFYPNDQLLIAAYSYEFKSRLMYSFLTVSWLFAFYEYARQRSYVRMQKISQKFEQQARHDPLSGLQNRRGMLEKLHYEHERTKRNHQHMSLMMCDIDHFKKINDDFGHNSGDIIIKELADIFSAALRKQDTVARWGGEEFLFLLPETNADQAIILGEKIRNKIANSEFGIQEKSIKLTASIGVYEVMDSNSIENAISYADKNLYKAKSSGRNRCVMISAF